jgi:hypothetical protein
MQDRAKLLLTLYNGIIAARRFRWISGGLLGIDAMQTDGSSRLFAVTDEPTELMYLGLDENVLSLPYSKLKEILSHIFRPIDESDELPWLSYDDHGNPIAGQVESEAIIKWLTRKVEIGDERYESWGARSASEYAPGFEIMRSLSQLDIDTLGLREVDLGGPASSVPAISTHASINEFNNLMNLRKLPYVVVDDEISEEY